MGLNDTVLSTNWRRGCWAKRSFLLLSSVPVNSLSGCSGQKVTTVWCAVLDAYASVNVHPANAVHVNASQAREWRRM